MASSKSNLFLATVVIIYTAGCCSALTLQCKFDDYLYDKNYKCEVEGLDVTATNQIVSDVSGLHIPRRTNADVIILSIDGQTAHYLPQGLDKFFPNVIYLNINKSGLKEITKNDLKNFPQLRNIAVRGNEIESLPGDLFEYNTQITNIGFAGNKIKSIGNDIFKSLNNLESVNLLRNTCISQQATNRSEIAEMMESASECFE
jgi:Leucine-rich repeat (LRR) protein